MLLFRAVVVGHFWPTDHFGGGWRSSGPLTPPVTPYHRQTLIRINGKHGAAFDDKPVWSSLLSNWKTLISCRTQLYPVPFCFEPKYGASDLAVYVVRSNSRWFRVAWQIQETLTIRGGRLLSPIISFSDPSQYFPPFWWKLDTHIFSVCVWISEPIKSCFWV